MTDCGAYFSACIYHWLKLTPTTLKRLYEPHRASEQHYMAQTIKQLKEVFYWKNKEEKESG